MIHLFKSAAARTFTFTLVGLLVVGLLIGTVRLTLPFADLFRSQVEGLLEETLGLEVRVGRFGLRLAGGWVPRLTLQDVELLDPNNGRIQLGLKALRLDLDLAATVRQLSPQVASLTLVGARLEVKRRLDGTVVVAGLEGVEAGGDPRAMTFFLANGRFLLDDSDILWVDDYAKASPLHISDVRLRFDNTDSRHRIGLLARLFDDPDTDVHLAGALTGAPGQPRDWSGDFYLKVQGRNLGPMLRGRFPAGFHVGSDSLLVESWSRVAGSALVHSINRVAVDGLVAWRDAPGGSPAPLRLEQMDAFLRWERAGEGWALDVADLSFTRGGRTRPQSDLALRYVPLFKGGWSLHGGIARLDLADLAAVSDLVPDLPLAVERLREAGLGGGLEDLRLSFEQPPKEKPHWGLSGRILDLVLDPGEQMPGVRGLDLRFAASDERGSLTLTSYGLTLSQPRLLGAPIHLDRLAGDLYWYQDTAGRLQVEVPDLAAENADVRTRTRLAFMLPPDGGDPFLDLHTQFTDVDLSAIRRYIPTPRIKAKLATWLDRAFVAGRIPSGSLLFRGTPADFPFDGQEGRFQVLLGLEDLTLDYNPDWPRFEHAAGELRFENRGMDVTFTSARLLESDVLSCSARIPDLSAATAVEVEGRVEGPFSDGLKILTETPLEKRLGAAGRAFQVDGGFQVNIRELSVPLRHKGRKGPLRVKGEIFWPDQASLALARWEPLKLEGLSGVLSFTEASLSTDSVAAQLWGQPINLRVSTEPAEEDKSASTRIEAGGTFPAEVLARRFPLDLWQLVRGQTRLDLSLGIQNAEIGQAGFPLAFALDSRLVGVTVDLPAPLGKGSPAVRQLHLEGSLVPGADLDARGRYGDLGFDLQFVRDGAGSLKLTRGNLKLGGAAAPARAAGLGLDGSIDTLDLPAWINWWEERQAAGTRRDAGIALRSADLEVRHLVLSELACNDVRLKLKRVSNRWEARVDARELAGKIRIPQRARSEPLRIQLDRLDLAALFPEGGKAGQSLAQGKRRSDPRQTHTLELRVERLLWDDNVLGSLSIDSRELPDGIELSPIRLAGKLMTIDGAASWTMDGGNQRTFIDLKGKGDDLGEILHRMGFASLLNQAPATANLDLHWSGGPAELSAATLDGGFEVDVGKGTLLEVEPGVGRMLGILNFGALQRRLSLDFSDLFDRGYAFEHITGKLTIDKGKTTIEELLIEGPSATIGVEGSTDLVEQQFDQIVTVIPRIGTSVALAGAVAGGPLVGAAVYIADRVTGGAVDKLGSYQYDITGPWADPEIRLRGTRTGGDQQVFLPDHDRAGAERAQEEKPSAAPAEGSVEPLPTPAQEDSPEEAETNLFLDGF